MTDFPIGAHGQLKLVIGASPADSHVYLGETEISEYVQSCRINTESGSLTRVELGMFLLGEPTTITFEAVVVANEKRFDEVTGFGRIDAAFAAPSYDLGGTP